MKIFISGGTGFVGSRLASVYLDKGWEVVAAGTSSKHPLTGRQSFEYISADTTQPGNWQLSVKDADAVVNLAGRSIFNIWTEHYKTQIYESRILTTRNLVDAIESEKPVVLLSASAAGYYGDQNDEILTESAEPGEDFLARVCVDWESEACRAAAKDTRVVLMRFGVVMGPGGGALSKMLPAYKFFVGGPLGSGRHWFPWMHIDDLAAASVHLLQAKEAAGPFNFCAPGTIRYREFSRTLGQMMHRPSFMRTPAFLLKLITGEMGSAMLNSQRAVPEKLEKSGFVFRYPELASALGNVLG
jgi:uncharacterized protein (TIGR01777 family)